MSNLGPLVPRPFGSNLGPLGPRPFGPIWIHLGALGLFGPLGLISAWGGPFRLFWPQALGPSLGGVWALLSPGVAGQTGARAKWASQTGMYGRMFEYPSGDTLRVTDLTEFT